MNFPDLPIRKSMVRWSVCAISVGLALCLTGCGAKSNVPPPTPLKPLKMTSVELSIVGQSHPGEGVSDASIEISPAVGYGEVVLASETGQLDTIIWGSLNSLWRIQLQGNISCTPLITHHHVYVGTLQGQLYAINRATGERDWTVQLPSSLYATPAVSGDTLIVHVHNGQVMAFSVETGKSLWSYQSDQPDLLLQGDSVPVIAGNQVLVGLHSGVLVSLSLSTGHVMWAEPISIPVGSSSVLRMVDIVDTPIVDLDRGVVFVGTYQGRLAALTLDAGRVLWSTPMSISENMAYHQGVLYVTTVSGAVEAVDGQTGQVMFVQKSLEYRQVSAPVWLNHTLVVSDYEGYVHAIDPATGHLMGRIRPFLESMAGPGVAYVNQLYEYSANGRFAILKVKPEGTEPEGK